MVSLQQLLPDGGAAFDLPAEREQAFADGLVELYAQDAGVRLAAVVSLDGAMTGPDGTSDTISPDGDRTMLRLQRGLADVVLAGAGTARGETYRAPSAPAVLADRRAALGMAPAPRLVVVTRSGDIAGVPAFSGPAAHGDAAHGALPPWVLTCTAGASRVADELELPEDGLIVAGDDDVDLAAGLADLASRGLTRVLCEGGPQLNRTLQLAGLADELCLTISPTLSGRGPSLLGAGEMPNDSAPGYPLRHLLAGGGALFGRWAR